MVRSSIIVMDATAGAARRTQRRAKEPPDTRHGTRAGASAGSADPWRDVAVRASPSSAPPGPRVTRSAARKGVGSTAGVRGADVTRARDRAVTQRRPGPRRDGGAPGAVARVLRSVGGRRQAGGGP